MPELDPAVLVATDGWAGGVVLGLALWVGFPFVLGAGAVVHDNVPAGSPPSTPATGS